MRTQLKIQDNLGHTVAIHAARGGDVALLGAVAEEIFKQKVRPLLNIQSKRMLIMMVDLQHLSMCWFLCT